jgi:hypothetical protein
MGLFDFLKKRDARQSEAVEASTTPSLSFDKELLTKMAQEQAQADADHARANGITLTPEMLEKLAERRGIEALRSLGWSVPDLPEE